MTEKPLDPRYVTHEIATSEPFARELAGLHLKELPSTERHNALGRAMASAAIERGKELAGEPDRQLEATTYTLVSHIPSFFKGSHQLEHLHQTFNSPSDMPRHTKDRFYQAKEDVIQFNHALHEMINEAAPYATFDSLLSFMTTMYGATNPDTETVQEFNRYAKRALVGIRNEMAFEQILIANGVADFYVGTPEDDALGGDFIINGVPIDVKSSQAAVDRAKEKATARGYDTSNVMWSHITPQDYNNRLTLTFDRAKDIFNNTGLQADLERAVKNSS